MDSGYRIRASVLISAAYCALFVAWIVLDIGGPVVTRVFDDFALMTAAVAAGGACLAASRRATNGTSRAWVLLGLACLAFAAGQCIWAVYQNVLGRPTPFPSLADAGYLAASPLAALAILDYPCGLKRLSRARSAVDTSLIAVSLFFVSWVTVLGPTVRAGSGPLLAQAIGLAYPTGNLLVCALVMAKLARSPRRDRTAMFLIASGVLVLALTNTAYLFLSLKGVYQTGSLIDPGWIVAFALIGLAACRTQRAPEPVENRVGPPSWMLVLPHVAVAVAVAAAVWAAEVKRVDGFVIGVLLVVAALSFVRQALVVEESRSAEHALAKTADELEQSYRRVHASEGRYRGIVETAQEGVWVLDSAGSTTFVNSKAAAMLGLGVAQMLGRPLLDFVDPDHVSVVAAKLERWRAGEAEGDEVKFRRADGAPLWGLVGASPVVDDDGQSAGTLAMVSDITARKAAEEALVHQAFHDTLTGLANRALFLDRLDHALSRRRARAVETAVLFLDLDRFKAVNDNLGHGAGDELLVGVARRLESVVRPSDTVARLGGDEFVVLCEELDDEREAMAIAERVTKAVSAPFAVEGHHVTVTTSIGIAFASPAAYDTADALLRDADAAMYRAKEAGRDDVEVFNPEVRARTLQRLEAEAALLHAIDNGELRVHYQPVMDLGSSQVAGVEALVRWQRDDDVLVPPMEFIPLAEDSGLIVPLGAFVLREACHQVAAWNRRRPAGPPLSASVNLSARQLSSPGLVELVSQALADSGLEPISLCLEITESVLMEDAEASRAALEALKGLGVSLAVDDFGTGYSSLLYLRRFPVDGLKVDRSFVAGLGESREDSAIVAGVVGLAHALGMSAVAEGVETAEQAARLREMGCGLAQGFHWSRPMPAEELERWLDQFWIDAASAAAEAIRVLVVDDHPTFRQAARLALELEGCFDVVAEAGDGKAAVELARIHQPDLVLLDLVMPGMGGLEALPHILEVAPGAKVAFLTALDSLGSASKPLVDAAGFFAKADMSGVAKQLAALVAPGGPKAQCFPIAPLSVLTSATAR